MRTAKVIFGFSKRAATTERKPQQPHNVRNRIADDAPLSESAGACGTLTGTLLTKPYPLVGWVLNDMGPDPRGLHLHPEMR